jgi:HemY protein
MWRVLIYLAVIAALAFGAVWLAEQPGSVAFVWNGVSYSVGLAIAALALLVLIATILIIEAIARIILNLPQRLSFASRERRKRKGILALSRGMIAVGSGDETAARRYAREVERYLRKDEPLLLLLRAQAAQVSGDRALAEKTFQEMTESEETRVLGLRGLYVEARRRGDQEAAWRHASEASRLAPAVDWANEAVLEGLCAKGDWRAAMDTVERRAALGLIDKATSKRHRAVLLTADALSRGESDEEGALASVKEAIRLAPDLVPAAALAGQILGRRLELRKAAKIVEAAWTAVPHPELASVYTHLRPGDSTHDRMERAEKLATLASWGPEGRIALSRAALEAREFKKARETLKPILTERPSVRVCLLMADIERIEHGTSGRAREWLARAVHAPRDKAWIADGVVSDRWSPISPVSGRLDAFRWDSPPALVSGVGSSVIDDVIGDLDDHPGAPLPLAAPTYGRAEEAEIIAPEPRSANAALIDRSIADERAAEARAAEKAQADMKAGEAEAAEKRAAEIRAQEDAAREAAKRTAEKRAAEERLAEQKAAEMRAAEKLQAEKLEAERREAEKRAAEKLEAEREAEKQAAARRAEEARAAEARAAEMKAAEAERATAAASTVEQPRFAPVAAARAAPLRQQTVGTTRLTPPAPIAKPAEPAPVPSPVPAVVFEPEAPSEAAMQPASEPEARSAPVSNAGSSRIRAPATQKTVGTTRLTPPAPIKPAEKPAPVGNGEDMEEPIIPLTRLPDDPGPEPREKPEPKRSRFSIFGSG